MFRFKGFLVATVGLVLAAGQVCGEEATLLYKLPKRPLLPFRNHADARQFSAPTEGAGTVSPHAVIVAMEGPIRFHVAIDATTPDAAQPDVLRFDFSGQERFSDQNTVPLEIRSHSGNVLVARIGPGAVRVPRDGQMVRVGVMGDYVKAGAANRELKIGFDFGIKGPCDFGGKKLMVCVVDGDGNLHLGDAFQPRARDGRLVGRTGGDTVVIDTGDGTFEDPTTVVRYVYGQPIWINGSFYDVKVSSDGKGLSAARLDLPAGRIRIANANWELLLVSPERVMWLTSTEPGKALEIPPGRYTVMRYKQYAEFDKSDDGAILMESPNDPYMGQLVVTPRDPVVEVAADATADLAIGTPLAAKISVRKQEGVVVFAMDVTDAGGRKPNYVQLKGGERPAKPKIRVMSADGKEIHSATMEYG